MNNNNCRYVARLAAGVLLGLALGVIRAETTLDTGLQTNSIALTAGWNLIALPLEPSATNVAEVLQSIEGRYDSVWSYRDDHWAIFNPLIPELRDLNSLQCGVGYWIKMHQAAVLTVIGHAPLNAVNSNEGISLNLGWNLVGYSSMRTDSVADVFSSISGRFTVASSQAGTWLMYQSHTLGANMLTNMTPYCGYWVRVTEPSVWLAPNFHSQVADAETDLPVAGAIVSLDGIDADEPTDSQGKFIIRGISDERGQLLTVNAPGYLPFSMLIDTYRQGEIIPYTEATPATAKSIRAMGAGGVKLTPLPTPAVGDAIVPQNRSHWRASSDCGQAGIRVAGYTSLSSQNTFRYDIVFVIDTSGSMGKKVGSDLDKNGVEDTTLDVALYACKGLLQQLQGQNVRFGLVKFARYNTRNARDGGMSDGPVLSGQTRIIQSMTDQSSLIQSGLDVVATEGPIGGTHTAKGIDLAVQVFAEAPPVDPDRKVTPLKHIVLLTDGVPTLPVEPGETQQRKDRLETILAAQKAKKADIFVHPVVIDPANANERHLTTMPTIQAVTGVPGLVHRVNQHNLDSLPLVLATMPLTSMTSVRVRDLNSGQLWSLPTQPDGRFDATLPAALGSNTWELEFLSNNTNNPTTRTVSFTVHAADAAVDFSTMTADETPVRDLDYLERPTGGAITNRLLPILKSKYPEARLLSGVECFRAINGQVTVEFIYKNADWQSDVGFFPMLPEFPPDTAAEVIASLANSSILISTKFMKNANINVAPIVRRFQVGAGTVFGMYFIPNGTLAQAQKGHTRAPLFTLSDLNPGGYDQVLIFYDPAGQQIICAYEDVDILSDSGDQDFEDLIFVIKSVEVVPNQSTCLDF